MGFRNSAQRKWLFFVPLLFFLIGASPPSLAAAGCNPDSAQAIRRDVEMDTLKDAVKAFESGDYEKAQTGFEMLSNEAKNSDIRRSALFGLATTRLALADNRDEYNRAMTTWKKWAGEVKSCKGLEDPRMLTPFLLRLQSAIGKGAGGPLGEKAKKKDEFRGIVLMKEKVVHALQWKLELAERQIRQLRHDLKSLDEIHRKYEEKKQEMTP
ncbi:MAG: hypothetical protein ACP5SH_06990 [Syntrophobacteraceae bacterium]